MRYVELDATPIIRAVISPEELYTCGVGHVHMPLSNDHISKHFRNNGYVTKWVASVNEGTWLQASVGPNLQSLAHDVYVEFTRWLEACIVSYGLPWQPSDETNSQWDNSGVMRFAGDGGSWHYDTDLSQAEASEPSLLAAGRANPRRLNNRCTMPFPLETQPPTICVPWGGIYAGKPVQAPLGYLTMCLGGVTLHRADARPGLRGRYTKNAFFA